MSEQAEVQPRAVVALCANCGGIIYPAGHVCWPGTRPPDALKLLEEWLAGGSKRGVTGIWREGCTWKVRLTNKEPSFGPTLSAAILAALEATR